MTESPFLTNLGDAFDDAIAAQPVRRSRLIRRRPVLVAVAFAAAAMLALAAIAVARIVSSPDELAARGIACYAQPDLGSDATIVENSGSPVRACADAFRRSEVEVPQLVACAADSSVAVIPGRSAVDCRRAGLQPLPSGYDAASAKTARLQTAVLSLEAEHDCVSPGQLARGVQRLLDRGGWTGWKAEIGPRPLSGPCGTVSGLDGAGRRTIGGALDPDRHVVMVSGGASRSTMALLYGDHGIARTLEDESGSRCFSVAELRSLAERQVGAGRSISVVLDPRVWSAPGVSVADARWDRYRAGCSVIADVRPAGDGHDVVVVIPTRG